MNELCRSEGEGGSPKCHTYFFGFSKFVFKLCDVNIFDTGQNKATIDTFFIIH
jgi:hypothetical protein